MNEQAKIQNLPAPWRGAPWPPEALTRPGPLALDCVRRGKWWRVYAVPHAQYEVGVGAWTETQGFAYLVATRLLMVLLVPYVYLEECERIGWEEINEEMRKLCGRTYDPKQMMLVEEDDKITG